MPRQIRKLQKEHFGFNIWLVRDKRTGYRIHAGCRNFSHAKAVKHWNYVRRHTYYYGGCTTFAYHSYRRMRARNMLELLPKLKKRAYNYGWRAKK